MPEPQWRNPVRARLEAGDPVLALTVTTSNLEVAALGASLGFDFLWVEMEHSPITLETLRAMVLATRSLPAAVFARVPVVELWTAKRVLDQHSSERRALEQVDPQLAHAYSLLAEFPKSERRRKRTCIVFRDRAPPARSGREGHGPRAKRF